MKMFLKLFRYLIPDVDKDVLQNVDRKNLQSLYYIAFIVLVVETVSDVLFLIHRALSMPAGGDLYEAQDSVLFCIMACLAATLLSSRMLKNKNLSHGACILFKLAFFSLMLLWSGYVDYNHYLTGEHMLVITTVILVVICFGSFVPWMGILFFGAGYLAFFLVLYRADQAVSINKFNYVVMMLVCVGANTFLYHVRLRAAKTEIEQEKKTRMLENISMHDALTGLLNRLALEREAQAAGVQPLSAYMIDINYFKLLNDKYGHNTGDKVLQVTGDKLKTLFPGANVYRYGGDEFLVLSHAPKEKDFNGDIYTFVYGEQSLNIYLAIGYAHGTPMNYAEVFELIAAADKSLYSIKNKTHAEDGQKE